MDVLDEMLASPRQDGARREAMLEADEVGVMVGLHNLGFGTRRIAAELGCSRTTVKRYLELGGWSGAVIRVDGTIWTGWGTGSRSGSGVTGAIATWSGRSVSASWW
jgi:hypothetical protein